MKKRALISVSDKTGIISFAKRLVALGYEIVSTGGTNTALQAEGIATIAIDAVTDFPEMLDGRVKTLHPLIHGGLLAVRDNTQHQKQVAEHHIHYIDLVCVNLYPFKETISKPSFTHQEAVENIDIGGPSMLRSAAKNHAFVTVVTDSADYETVLAEIEEHGDTSLETRQHLAAKVFRLTASYDAMIASYMTDYVQEEAPSTITMTYSLKQSLRYGENPHQQAAFYESLAGVGYSMAHATQLQGKELSYNNIQDGNAALQIVKEFPQQIAVTAVKHMNPCGVGIGQSVEEAYQKAYDSDPVSIFGGIVALNDEVNEAVALKMSELFLEIILAPSFSDDALKVLSKKKNLRVLCYCMQNSDVPIKQFVSVNGGLLVQSSDTMSALAADLQQVTSKAVESNVMSDLLFAEKVCKHVKSNAIVIAGNGQTYGIGAGQMNRVQAVGIALTQAGEKAKGAVMASDAFFPMDDTVRLAAAHGISAIIQPGGSLKDKDSIAACDELGIAMVFSGKRHFKH